MASLPRELQPLFRLVQKYAKACPLPTFKEKGKPRQTYFEKFPRPEGLSKLGWDLSGQCDNAASMFKFLAGGVQLGWKTGRLSGEEWPPLGDGSHFFVFWGKNPASAKLFVDPTAEQFPNEWGPIPYEKAKAQTSGGDRGLDPHGRRYPKQASRGWHKAKGWQDHGIRAVLKDPQGPEAVAKAIAWAEKKSGVKFPKADPSIVKLPPNFPGFDESYTGVRQPAYEVNDVFVRSLLGSPEVVKITLTPLGREELKMKLTTLGRKRRNPQLAKEVMLAMKKRQGETLTLSREAANFVKEELEHSLQILKDPSFRSDPSFAYQQSGIEHSLRNIHPVLGQVAGPASVLLAWISDARRRTQEGTVDLDEVHSLVDAARSVLQAKEQGDTEGGCIVMRDGQWRVIDQGTGELWPQTFDSKQGATDAIAAYQRYRRPEAP